MINEYQAFIDKLLKDYETLVATPHSSTGLL
ncbi:MAG: hypothetical protein JWR72_874 [Flavisolibacter sp.]|nr:hypothetical protein [Flavisolibacter sp.]